MFGTFCLPLLLVGVLDDSSNPAETVGFVCISIVDRSGSRVVRDDVDMHVVIDRNRMHWFMYTVGSLIDASRRAAPTHTIMVTLSVS